MTGQPDGAVALVLSKLGSVKRSGAGWQARCPAHEDKQASLHLEVGSTQPVVMTCHAGCERDDVLTELGLTWADLCKPRDHVSVTPISRAARGEWMPGGKTASAVYDYIDEHGEVLFQVLRSADKDFRQRVPDKSAKSGYRWHLDGVRRVLYRLPKIIEAVQDGEIVYICEGEKDVHALEYAGVPATCNPGGAGKWRPEYSEVFRDALVRIVADGDVPGRKHAREVLAALQDIARGVEVVEAVTGKDAADHLAAGHGPGDFLVTHESELAAEPELAPDLYEFLAEEDLAEVWVIPHLLERSDRLIWTGEEGLGKSFFSRQLAVGAAAGIHPLTDVIFKPQKVLFIDCENPVRKSRRVFRNLEKIARLKHRPVPDGMFRIIHRPAGLDLSRSDDRDWLIERVTAHKPDLLVIGPLYKLHALDINEEQAARVITGVLDEARVIADCAMVIEAHAPHGQEGMRALRPYGSSLFMRWPEFGYGIRMAPPAEGGRKTRRRVACASWRGPREEREWPRFMEWGTGPADWPWVESKETSNGMPVPAAGDWSPSRHAVA